jgi:hypothetical protein
LGTPDEEKRVAGHEKRIGPIARKLCESRIDLAAGAGIEAFELKSEGRGSRLLGRERKKGSPVWIVMLLDNQRLCLGLRHFRKRAFEFIRAADQHGLEPEAGFGGGNARSRTQGEGEELGP